MNKYKLWVFDFDGTLVDTAPDIAFYINETLVTRGLKSSSLQDVKDCIGWGVHELVQKLASKQSITLNQSDVESIVTEFKFKYRAAPTVRSKPYDGVMEVLSEDLKSVQKSIVTNKPHDLTMQILQELEMDHFFTTVIGTGIGFDPKPSINSTEEVIKKAGALSSNTLFVGDSRIDQATAKKADLDFAWMTYGYDEKWTDKPEYVFNSAFEWRTILNEYV